MLLLLCDLYSEGEEEGDSQWKTVQYGKKRKQDRELIRLAAAGANGAGIVCPNLL